MERRLDTIAYLLARLVSNGEGTTIEEVLKGAEDFLGKPERAKRTTPPTDKDAVERVYALYPTKCPVSGRATGKSSKDKEKIGRLLRTYSEEKLSDIISRYIAECYADRSYIKNFSTFLNNLPDYAETEDDPHIVGPSFSDPGAYIDAAGYVDTTSRYPNLEEANAAREIRMKEYYAWKKECEDFDARHR